VPRLIPFSCSSPSRWPRQRDALLPLGTPGARPAAAETWARILTVTIVALGVAMPALSSPRAFCQDPSPGGHLGLVHLDGVGFLLVAFLAWRTWPAWWRSSSRGTTPFRARPRAADRPRANGGRGRGRSGGGALRHRIRSALSGIQIKQLDVKLRGLPQQLAGFRLVQISDVHIGPLCARTGSRISSSRSPAAPDLVAITGDLVDAACTSCASTWPSGEDRGAAASTSSPGTTSITPASGVVRAPSFAGRPAASQRAVEVAPAWSWPGSRIRPCARPGRGAARTRSRRGAGAPRPPAAPVRQAAKRGVPLTLSGHTHGGQIWPFSWLVALAQPYLAGLHRRGESQLYVSRGTGFWARRCACSPPPRSPC